MSELESLRATRLAKLNLVSSGETDGEECMNALCPLVSLCCGTTATCPRCARPCHAAIDEARRRVKQLREDAVRDREAAAALDAALESAKEMKRQARLSGRQLRFFCPWCTGVHACGARALHMSTYFVFCHLNLQKELLWNPANHPLFRSALGRA